jgi:lipoprotein-anchoring transpeptidase ErfK/SrfK
MSQKDVVELFELVLEGTPVNIIEGSKKPKK